MMAFPAFKEIRDLYITVDVGFVDGIRATTTPTGTASYRANSAMSTVLTSAGISDTFSEVYSH